MQQAARDLQFEEAAVLRDRIRNIKENLLFGRNKMNNKLLQNAINSIEIGIEDYKLSQQDERRIISCVRNVFAGILLLFKYKFS